MLLEACVRVLDGACGGVFHSSFFKAWNSSGVLLGACVRVLDGACGRVFPVLPEPCFAGAIFCRGAVLPGRSILQSSCGLVAMTSALHAEGRQLDPGQV